MTKMFRKFNFNFWLFPLCISILHSSIANQLMSQRGRENVTRWWRNQKYSVSGAVTKMTSRISLNETMGFKQLSFLQNHPRNFDVAFAVGPERIIVKAPKLFLTVASPVFEREFAGRWENALSGEAEIFSLPDLNPEAFKLFVELTIVDSWSVESLKAMELPMNQLLHLMSVCRKYGMKNVLNNLTELAKDFLSDFTAHVKPEDFLLLSQAQLETILASDELTMEETDVFDYACRWAEEQCRKQGLEAKGDNLRLVLGSVLYQVRFSVMTITEFAKVIQLKGLLSVDEIAEIVQFIVVGQNNSKLNDTTEVKFKVEKRKKNVFVSTPIGTSSITAETTEATTAEATTDATTITTEVGTTDENLFTSVPAGSSVVSVAQAFPVVDTPFVCDGNETRFEFIIDMEIILYGVGFVGPVDADSFYNVTVHVGKKHDRDYSEVTRKLKKRILAKKSKTFYFIFEQPVVLDKTYRNFNFPWNNHYYIWFSLEGPNTRSLRYDYWVTKTITDGSNEFDILGMAPQLVEIVYKTVD